MWIATSGCEAWTFGAKSFCLMAWPLEQAGLVQIHKIPCFFSTLSCRKSLQNCDFSWVSFVYIFQVVTTVMGTGDPRDLTCTNPACSNGQAVKQKLLAPKALASAPDGAIYVADYNLIRKITPDGLVSSLLKLKWVIVCNLCNSTYYSLECLLLWSFRNHICTCVKIRATFNVRK